MMIKTILEEKLVVMGVVEEAGYVGENEESMWEDFKREAWRILYGGYARREDVMRLWNDNRWERVDNIIARYEWREVWGG